MKFYHKWILKLILSTKGAKKMLEKVRLLLAGKKAYLTAAGMIIAALVEYAANNDTSALINRILEAIALVTVRAAVTKTKE
jgi:hypothetical protein